MSVRRKAKCMNNKSFGNRECEQQNVGFISAKKKMWKIIVKSTATATLDIRFCLTPEYRSQQLFNMMSIGQYSFVHCPTCSDGHFSLALNSISISLELQIRFNFPYETRSSAVRNAKWILHIFNLCFRDVKHSSKPMQPKVPQSEREKGTRQSVHRCRDIPRIVSVARPFKFYFSRLNGVSLNGE